MVIQAAVNQETSTVFRFLPILYRSAKIRCLNLHLIRTACKCFRSSSHFRSRYGNSRVWKKSYCLITGFPPFANLCCRGREPNQLRAPKRGAWRPRTWWGRRGYRLRWRRRPTRPRGRRPTRPPPPPPLPPHRRRRWPRRKRRRARCPAGGWGGGRAAGFRAARCDS